MLKAPQDYLIWSSQQSCDVSFSIVHVPLGTCQATDLGMKQVDSALQAAVMQSAPSLPDRARPWVGSLAPNPHAL